MGVVGRRSFFFAYVCEGGYDFLIDVGVEKNEQRRERLVYVYSGV